MTHIATIGRSNAATNPGTMGWPITDDRFYHPKCPKEWGGKMRFASHRPKGDLVKISQDYAAHCADMRRFAALERLGDL